jgi:hypothetical protein
MEPTIQDIAFKRALLMLNAAGAQYAIVYNGETHGTLELAPPPKVRRRGPGMYPPGTTRAHFLPHLEKLQPAGHAKIPYADFDVGTLQSNTAAFCASKWGAGSASVKRYDSLREIHVLRFF